MFKPSEGKVKYNILIKAFHKKIKTFKNGKKIHSRVFKIGESSFRIDIYPNGDKKEYKGKVGVFLTNMSDWRVRLKANFEAVYEEEDENEEASVDRYFEANET